MSSTDVFHHLSSFFIRDLQHLGLYSNSASASVLVIPWEIRLDIVSKRVSSRPIPSSSKTETHLIKNHPNHQATARTHRDIFPIAEVIDRNLKPVAARTRVMVDLDGRIEGHIFNLDLIIDGEGFVGHFDIVVLLKNRGTSGQWRNVESDRAD